MRRERARRVRGGRLAALALLACAMAGCGGGSSGSSASSGSTGGSPTPAPTPTPSATGTPTVVFSDEFNETSLDRTKWNAVGPDFWVNSEQQAYFDSPDTILLRQGVSGADGGVLTLRVVYSPGTDTNLARHADFISGRIDTSSKYDFTYGKVEARIRMSDAVGFWPAFWLLGYGTWPDAGEIDIMENVGYKDWISSAMHGPGYSGNTPITSRFDFPAGEDTTGWHVYAIDWTASSVTFEVDGKTFYTVTTADVEKYGTWKFDNPKYIILNAALGGSYPYATNSVTTPYYGVPQATVDKIKAGDVQMDVDWVRVEQTK